jgi:hypothetical protein
VANVPLFWVNITVFIVGEDKTAEDPAAGLEGMARREFVVRMNFTEHGHLMRYAASLSKTGRILLDRFRGCSDAQKADMLLRMFPSTSCLSCRSLDDWFDCLRRL